MHRVNSKYFRDNHILTPYGHIPIVGSTQPALPITEVKEAELACRLRPAKKDLIMTEKETEFTDTFIDVFKQNFDITALIQDIQHYYGTASSLSRNDVAPVTCSTSTNTFTSQASTNTDTPDMHDATTHTSDTISTSTSTTQADTNDTGTSTEVPAMADMATSTGIGATNISTSTNSDASTATDSNTHATFDASTNTSIPNNTSTGTNTSHSTSVDASTATGGDHLRIVRRS